MFLTRLPPEGLLFPASILRILRPINFPTTRNRHRGRREVGDFDRLISKLRRTSLGRADEVMTMACFCDRAGSLTIAWMFPVRDFGRLYDALIRPWGPIVSSLLSRNLGNILEGVLKSIWGCRIGRVLYDERFSPRGGHGHRGARIDSRSYYAIRGAEPPGLSRLRNPMIGKSAKRGPFFRVAFTRSG